MIEAEQREASMVNVQRGGVNISGIVGSVGGDIVGGDKITVMSMSALDDALRPVHDAIAAAPADARGEAEAKLAALTQEAAKGKAANDGAMAKLIEGFVALVPAGVSAVVGAFGTPLLAGIAGPATSYVLGKLKGG